MMWGIILSSHMHRNIMKDRRVLARKGRPKSDLSAFEFHETRYWQQTLEWRFLPKSQTQRQKISLKWKSVVEDLATGLEKKYVTQTNAQRRFVYVWIPRNEHHHIRPKETAQTDNIAYDLLDELETNLSLSPCEDIYLTNLTKHSSQPFPWIRWLQWLFL